MDCAKSYQEILPGVFRWEMFSADHKVELTSHAVLVEGRLYCFDPIPLAAEAMDQLAAVGKPTAIILTSENHIRASSEWQNRWQVPIWASVEASVTMRGVTRFVATDDAWLDWELHPLPGGPGGEMAFRLASQSLVVMGDAVVNLPKRRLELLPDKYCRDTVELRRSLKTLIAQPFSKMVMAHGNPILADASAQVAGLI